MESKKVEWVFYTEDGDYSFKVNAITSMGAYNEAYDNYGPQVENMRYQQLKNAPDHIREKLNQTNRKL